MPSLEPSSTKSSSNGAPSRFHRRDDARRERLDVPLLVEHGDDDAVGDRATGAVAGAGGGGARQRSRRGNVARIALAWHDPGRMRLLERVVEKPHACAYLPAERASLEVRVMLDVTADEMDALLERGWRRFGPIYFRPACASCAECVSLRVVGRRFAPSKSQRRAARACGRLRRVVGPPRVDDARLALYAQWHASREDARGLGAQRADARALRARVRVPAPVRARGGLLRRRGGRPARRRRALRRDAAGALGRVLLLRPGLRAPVARNGQRARRSSTTRARSARAHVYLGYRVEGCASLRYKAAFRPHELLPGTSGALDDESAWHRKEGRHMKRTKSSCPRHLGEPAQRLFQHGALARRRRASPRRRPDRDREHREHPFYNEDVRAPGSRRRS